MRIAQVAPLYESVPPKQYGGTERVVSYLTEELVRQGHEVTLFASGDSETKAKLVPACPRAIWHGGDFLDALPHHVRLVELVFEDVSRFDVIHFHCDYVHFPLVRRHNCPSVTTLHGRLHEPDIKTLLNEYCEIPLISISNDQRIGAPDANWQGTVHHGLPLDLLSFNERGGDYLAFIGRFSPEKRADRAIEIARKSGIRLKIAAKVYKEEEPYFREVIEPLLRESAPLVEFVGEIDDKQKNEFLGSARALLFPIDWHEPFGLVMIEALACGTPVIGWRQGSVPEVIEPGVTGYVVESIPEAVRAAKGVAQLSRRDCRKSFETRFNVSRMTANYVDLYRRQVRAQSETAPLPAKDDSGTRNDNYFRSGLLCDTRAVT